MPPAGDDRIDTPPPISSTPQRQPTLRVGAFAIARLPRIVFGAGTLMRVPDIVAGFGTRVLLVTGAQSLQRSVHWGPLTDGLLRAGVAWEPLTVSGEPSPALVDDAVRRWHGAGLQAVVGIGGGSVLDAAKAVAGLLPYGNSVLDHLEGVGPERPYTGSALPYVAVPTTAGTGSEATRNAVLSVQGADGYKKSFRDERLVAQYAVVDPDLLATCAPQRIAANGMDALTQLLESFVSLRANPFTDALAWSGLEAARDGLLPWYQGGPAVPEARARMAYAALLSGITLAQTGLGSVHGLASPLGAFFPIPHGVVCGTLVAAATRINIRVLDERQPDNPALVKYARAGELLTGRAHDSPDTARTALVELLEEWTARLQLPRLGAYGVRAEDFPRIVAHCRGSSMRTNPVVLSDAEVTEVLDARC